MHPRGAVPTTPGNSRLFFAMYAVAAVGGSRWPSIFQILDMKPRWLDFLGHFGQHDVLDGDSVFLHLQVHAWCTVAVIHVVDAHIIFVRCKYHAVEVAHTAMVHRV